MISLTSLGGGSKEYKVPRFTEEQFQSLLDAKEKRKDHAQTKGDQPGSKDTVRAWSLLIDYQHVITAQHVIPAEAAQTSPFFIFSHNATRRHRHDWIGRRLQVNAVSVLIDDRGKYLKVALFNLSEEADGQCVEAWVREHSAAYGARRLLFYQDKRYIEFHGVPALMLEPLMVYLVSLTAGLHRANLPNQ